MAESTIPREEFANLFIMQVKGTMARALLATGTKPTVEQKAVLDMDDPDMRSIGEFFASLDLSPMLGFHEPREDHESESA